MTRFIPDPLGDHPRCIPDEAKFARCKRCGLPIGFPTGLTFADGRPRVYACAAVDRKFRYRIEEVPDVPGSRQFPTVPEPPTVRNFWRWYLVAVALIALVCGGIALVLALQIS